MNWGQEQGAWGACAGSKWEMAEPSTGLGKEQGGPAAACLGSGPYLHHPLPFLPPALQGPPALLSPGQGTQQPHRSSVGPLTLAHLQGLGPLLSLSSDWGGGGLQEVSGSGLPGGGTLEGTTGAQAGTVP